ncbi:hypothetical protein SBA2_980019 [Acidobacteriia bacterium SbA2]|nr:hypothetical protein SBA2_980019 [Acidobacteriia bacterium SbA2]
MGAKNLTCVLLCVSIPQAFCLAEKRGSAGLPSLVSLSSSTRDLEAKERLLSAITTKFPDSGPALLQLAETTSDADTRWMAIRGVGMLKSRRATPFLVRSLLSEHHYVRANAARALGEIRAATAGRALIDLLMREQDGGVIEQASLALSMIGAREAVPVLKSKATHPSVQTRTWIFQAIGKLGSKDDVPFLAVHLYNENSSASMAAAKAMERMVGIDFGFPKREGPSSPEESLRNARLWWEAHKATWGKTPERESPER